MNQFFYWIGALAIVLLLVTELTKRVGPWIASKRQKKTLKKGNTLDWSLIDNTINSDRLRRDCERQESLGICTGRECLVYESCDFNIKKVVH